MRVFRALLKILLVLVLVIIIGAAGLVGYLSITEYKPESVESIQITQSAINDDVEVGKMLKLLTFNTGYAGLDRNQDFFMDGGTMVNPSSKETVQENIAAIVSFLAQQSANIYLLQETDRDSSRTYGIDESAYYQHGLSLNMAFAYNYKCPFVPIPWPPIGKVASGITTLTNLHITQATRESLPIPFTWPMSTANLKRCLLIERIPVASSDKELVVINLHLEAYDNGEGKAAQTKQLMETMAAEYRNGNYVIAGGDFNQTFEGVTGYPILDSSGWVPGQLNDNDLPAGFRFVFDTSAPTCRLLNKPYDGDRKSAQFYVIDGFIVSDNLKVNHVETIDLNFKNSDHNPVRLEVTPI